MARDFKIKIIEYYFFFHFDRKLKLNIKYTCVKRNIYMYIYT